MSEHETTPAASAAQILIVDDHTHAGWVWAGALRRAGFRLSIAPDSYDGWHAVNGRAYALLIASQDQSGVEGMELIKKVRAIPNHLPCILVWEKTAPDESDMLRLLRPGTAFEKPVEISQLLSAVRALLADTEHSRAQTRSG